MNTCCTCSTRSSLARRRLDHVASLLPDARLVACEAHLSALTVRKDELEGSFGKAKAAGTEAQAGLDAIAQAAEEDEMEPPEEVEEPTEWPEYDVGEFFDIHNYEGKPFNNLAVFQKHEVFGHVMSCMFDDGCCSCSFVVASSASILLTLEIATISSRGGTSVNVLKRCSLRLE